VPPSSSLEYRTADDGYILAKRDKKGVTLTWFHRQACTARQLAACQTLLAFEEKTPAGKGERLAAGRDHVVLRAVLPITHEEAHGIFCRCRSSGRSGRQSLARPGCLLRSKARLRRPGYRYRGPTCARSSKPAPKPALPRRSIAVRFTSISRPQQDVPNATLCAACGLMHCQQAPCCGRDVSYLAPPAQIRT
jgi:hypothetical protein